MERRRLKPLEIPKNFLTNTPPALCMVLRYLNLIERLAKGTEMIRSAKISLVSNTTFLLTWEPRYNNSPCASIYRVCWGTNVTSASSCRDMNHTDTSCYVRGLTGDTLYTFQITAVLRDLSESDAYTLTAKTHSGTYNVLGSEDVP
uniref:Fibronectin type-III domain-containing protein n=1 Tax=Timema bartmani TaxID=61472 RepID=A0A7R9EW37_9NEOP|nr:unnamed protein product [Timema bartmani]